MTGSLGAVELVAGRPVRISDDEMVSTRRWMCIMSADAALSLRHLDSSALSLINRPGIKGGSDQGRTEHDKERATEHDSIK